MGIWIYEPGQRRSGCAGKRGMMMMFAETVHRDGSWRSINGCSRR